MEWINDDRDFHQLIVAPSRDTFCEVLLKSSPSKPASEQGQMVETCCAEKINKSQSQNVFVVWWEVMENKEPRMIVHPFTLLENKLPTNEKLEISLSLSFLL